MSRPRHVGMDHEVGHVTQRTTYRFIFNGSVMEVPLSKLSSVQLRALTATPTDYDLIVEGRGDQPDRQLGDGDVVDLSLEQVVVYVRSPTMFGQARIDGRWR